MSDTAYLTWGEFASGLIMAADTSGITSPDEQLDIMVQASNMADSYTRTRWEYQDIPHELHEWETDPYEGYWKGEVYPGYSPIRTIQNFTIDVAVDPSTGAPVQFTVPSAPAYNPWSTAAAAGVKQAVSGSAPNTTGQIIYDRGSGFVQPVYILLKFGILQAWPSLGIRPPMVDLHYTVGFDSTISGTINGSITHGSGVTVTLAKAVDKSHIAVGQSVVIDVGTSQETVVVSGVTTFDTDYGTNVSGFTATFAHDHLTGAQYCSLAPDGYAMPYPSWLRSGVRAIATAILYERALGAQGMGGIALARAADYQIRRSMGSSSANEFDIPASAKTHLRPHIRRSFR